MFDKSTDKPLDHTDSSLGAHPVNRYQNPQYRNYVLGFLTLIYAINILDRQLLSILQESIKQELLLSDTQLGLLTGFGFALFYVAAGIPIARWADRSDRRNIISIAAALWSVMTFLCSLATNYLQLFLARVGVGVGEAGCSPPAHSMISDMYAPEQRGTAMGIYSVGTSLGFLFGFLLGGVLNEYFGWRLAFVVVALPGVVLAIVFKMTVQEPLRGWSEKQTVSHHAISLRAVFTAMTKNRAVFHLLAGTSLVALASYSFSIWAVPFYIRQHGLGTAEIGVWLALASGILGGIGTFLGGYLADKFGNKDKRWYLWLPAFAALLVAPILVYILTSEHVYAALSMNLFAGLLFYSYLAPSVAMLHNLVDPRMRAMASAMLFFVANVIGAGCGPLIIGMLSDALFGDYGDKSLSTALLIVLPIVSVWGAAHYFIAAKCIHRQGFD